MGQELVVGSQPLTADEIRANVNLIQKVLRSVMKKDVHFGVIPGTQKNTLYKPGAEKILSTFRIAAGEPIIEDLTSEEIRYRVIVKGIHQVTNQFLGAGIGECSSGEEKYKWRRPVCKEEWDDTPEDRRREVWKKVEGKAVKLKQVRMNPTDVANTVLKMAHKRALVAMTLVVTAASDVFNQDIEDLPEEVREAVTDGEGKALVAQPQRASENGDIEGTIHDKLWAVCLKLGEGSEAMAHDILEKASSWKKEDGSSVKGKRNVKELSEKWAYSTYGKLTKEKPAHA